MARALSGSLVSIVARWLRPPQPGCDEALGELRPSVVHHPIDRNAYRILYFLFGFGLGSTFLRRKRMGAAGETGPRARLAETNAVRGGGWLYRVDPFLAGWGFAVC